MCEIVNFCSPNLIKPKKKSRNTTKCHNTFTFNRGKFQFDILLFILQKCYLHNSFTTNSRWQVVTDFKIDPRLISLLYPSIVAYLWFIVKILWHFIVFLNFFFGLVKFGEHKFTVLCTNFSCWVFVCLLL